MRAAWLCVFLLVAAPAVARDAASLRVVLPALPAQLDPHKAVTTADLEVARVLFLGLTAYDAEGSLTPGAATWQVSGDRLTYTFTLKPGLAWSDGVAVHARDYAAGISRALDPATAAPYVRDLFVIEGAEETYTGKDEPSLNVHVPDSLTLRVKLRRRSARFLEVLAQPIAAPIPRHLIRRVADAWTSPEQIIGNGPLRVDASGGAITLVRNTRSSAGSGTKAGRIEFLTASSADAAAERVRENEADLSLGFTLPGGDGRSRALRTDRGQQLLFVAANAKRDRLEKRELRHALAMSIDRESLVKSLRLPGAVAAFTLLPPALVPLATRRAPYARLPANYRAAIAEVLLRESNIDLNQSASFNLTFPAGAATAAAAKSIAASWARLGVALTLRERDQAAFEDALHAGDYDFALMTWPSREAGAWSFLGALEGGGSARNPFGYSEADFDQKLVDADIEDDPVHRNASLAEVEGVAIEDQIILPILFFTPQVSIRGDIGGWQPNPNGVHPLHLLSP